jgi:hypothetical protein
MSDTQIPSPPVTERERFWSHLIEERAGSGQSLRDFAAEKGVVASTLAWWGSEIKRREARRAGRLVPRRPEKKPKPIPLVPVTIADDNADSVFEVALPSGAAVRVPGNFDADSLRRLVAVLEEAC